MSLHAIALKLGAAAVLAIGVASCSALPQSGPSASAISASASSKVSQDVKTPYVLVDLNVDLLKDIPAPDPGSIYASFHSSRGGAPAVPVEVGDTVQVTIFESKAGGLFIPQDAGARPGNYVTLPAQTVGRDGAIRVPYAGLIRASGRSTTQIENDIQSKLATRAIEPQVVVNVTNQQGAKVTVVGSVNSPTTFELNASGVRILDAISDAGGLSDAAYDSFVTLRRGDRQATVFFNNLVTKPSENIYLAPGDTVYVYSKKRSFLVFGASGGQGLVDFDSEDVSLMEAIGKAGGLLDGRADPSEVFVYRIEPRTTVEKMGADLSAFASSETAIPTIYRINLRVPAGFFVAQQFQMRDKDILYISNSGYTDIAKFASLVTTVTGVPSTTTANAATTKSSIQSLD